MPIYCQVSLNNKLAFVIVFAYSYPYIKNGEEFPADDRPTIHKEYSV